MVFFHIKHDADPFDMFDQLMVVDVVQQGEINGIRKQQIVQLPLDPQKLRVGNRLSLDGQVDVRAVSIVPSDGK